MIVTTLQERLLNNIETIELVSRLGLSLFFGLSVIGFGCVMHLKGKNQNFHFAFIQISRIFFLLGTMSILVYACIQFILPMGSLTNQFYTLISFIFAFGVLLLNSDKNDYPALSFMIGSIIFLLMTLISFLEPRIFILSQNSSWFVRIHILLSILSESVFIISFCASILFLMNYNKLKRKESLIELTNIGTLEKVVVQSSFIGFALITFALISGLLLVFVGHDAPSIGFFKIFWAFFVWGWYAVTIFGRSFWGWRGRKGARLIIMGYLLLIIGLVGNILRYL